MPSFICLLMQVRLLCIGMALPQRANSLTTHYLSKALLSSNRMVPDHGFALYSRLMIVPRNSRRHCVPFSPFSSSSVLRQRSNQKRYNPHQNFASTTSAATSTASSTGQQLQQEKQYKTGYKRLFDLMLPEGRCVGLQLLDLPLGHPDELSPEAIQLRKPLTMVPSIQQQHIGETSSIHTPVSMESVKKMPHENNSTFISEPNSHHWIYDDLHSDEINYGLTMLRENSNNQRCFWLGRLALRTTLLDHLTASSIPTNEHSCIGGGSFENHYDYYTFIKSTSILKDSYGRPNVPKGFLASISHKDNIGVALVSTDITNSKTQQLNVNEEFNDDKRTKSITSIGIDIELRQSTRMNIARRVLTAKEINNLGKVDGISKEEEVLLRFSLKESAYKAIHPLLCQYIGFHEAEIQPYNDGTANVTLLLKSGAHTRLESITSHWQCCNDNQYFITSSKATLKETL